MQPEHDIPSEPTAATDPFSDPAVRARIDRYYARVEAFKAASGLRDDQFVVTGWDDVPFAPVQYIQSQPGEAVTLVPENVSLRFLTHPVYFCAPSLLQPLPTDGTPDRYALRVFHVLQALGLAEGVGGARPGVHPIDTVEGVALTDEERAAHRAGKPSPLDRVWFTEDDLAVSLEEVLTGVWEELEARDPEGNARLRSEREEQVRVFAEDRAARAAAAARAAGDAAEAAQRRQIYEAQTGLREGEYAPNDWGYLFAPLVTPRRGATQKVLVQAPAHVRLGYLGHPAYWCEPSITKILHVDGSYPRYCVRMQLTLEALGLLDQQGQPVDVLAHLGAQASEVMRRNHLKGRETPLDDVYITWERSRKSQRQIIEESWSILQELDPEGNAALAEAWQDQQDTWAHGEYLGERAAAQQAAADKIARKQARRAMLANAVLAVEEVRAERRAQRAADEADFDRKQEKIEREQRRLARELYIEQSLRRRR